MTEKELFLELEKYCRLITEYKHNEKDVTFWYNSMIYTLKALSELRIKKAEIKAANTYNKKSKKRAAR
jgi:hypothetical protein